MTKDQICKFLGCSMEQLNQQYAKNAATLRTMKEKSIRTGKKVGNATAAQLQADETKMQNLSK